MLFTTARHFVRGPRCLSSFNRRRVPLPNVPLNLKEFKYVDKTHLLAKILSTEESTYILAPAMRRIGKSMTIDIMYEMAKGNRELFEGMAVNKPDSPFQIGAEQFFCIKLSFDTVSNESLSVIDNAERFNKRLVEAAKEQHGLVIEKDVCPGETLRSWIKALTQDCNDKKIIMLIDEYDAPLTEFLPNSPESATEVAKMVRPFYKTIKERHSQFHKVFVTGVSKFAATSMFSDANQFWPLMEKSADFSNLYGFTKREIIDTYGVEIGELFEGPLEDTIEKMSLMYNGYRFHPDQEELIYNPWSIISALKGRDLGAHWTNTAASSTIIDTVGKHGMDVFHGIPIKKETLFAPVSATRYLENWKQVMFQTGYATITDVVRRVEGDVDLVLRPPNQEVRQALMGGFADKLTNVVSDKTAIREYGKSLRRLDFKAAQDNLNKLFNSIKRHSLPESEAQLSGQIISMLYQEPGFDLVYVDVPHKLDDEPTSNGWLISN